MPKPTAAANAATLLEESDELLALGAHLGAAMRRAAEQAKHLPSNRTADTAMQHTLDEVTAVRDMITTVKATTLVGAAIQIAEALERLDELAAEIESWGTPETSNADPEIRAIYRTLYSALEAVEDFSGHKLDDAITPMFPNLYNNPWAHNRRAVRKGDVEPGEPGTTTPAPKRAHA